MAINGIKYYSSGDENYEERPMTIGASATFVRDDPLTLSSGKVQLATATDAIVGFAQQNATSGANVSEPIYGSSVQVALAKVDMNYKISTSDGSNADITKIGQFANISGSSGAVKLDITSIGVSPLVSPGASITTANTAITQKQLEIVGVNPDGDDPTVYLVAIVNRQVTR